MLQRHRKFILYVISGSTATVANLLAVFITRQFTDYSTAAFTGAIVGTVTSYILSKTIVFGATEKMLDHAEIIRFLFVHAVVCFQVWGVSVSLEAWVIPTALSSGMREAIASLIGAGSVVFTGFFLHRYVTFRSVHVTTDRT